MRRLLLAAVGMGIASVAFAGQVWTKPGWYQVATTPVGEMLWKGPFDDEASCRQALPDNDEDTDFNCHYYETRPAIDDT